MKIELKAIIEINDRFNFSDKDEKEWFLALLDDKENTFLQLWNNDIGDEIGQTNKFEYKIYETITTTKN